METTKTTAQLLAKAGIGEPSRYSIVRHVNWWGIYDHSTKTETGERFTTKPPAVARQRALNRT